MTRYDDDCTSTDPEVETQFEKDCADIEAVIDEEIAGWIQRDIERLKACWVQSERIQHITARITTGVRIMQGYDWMVDFFTNMFEEMSGQPIPTEPVTCENWRFSIGSDMAWVTFDEISTPEGTGPGRLNQMKILEKQDGAWKIAATFGVPHRIGYYQCPWVQVSPNGTILNKSQDAEAAFKGHDALKIVGQRLCGRVTGDNIKLSEALIEAEDLINRLKMRAPQPLILSGPVDDQVSLCWVTIVDMIIVVLIGDDTLLGDAIDRAGKAYNLSHAQIRVAKSIAQGHDLSVTARNLNVQPSTIRTHVKRMFERLNVNSQPALIRALLSIDPPYS